MTKPDYRDCPSPRSEGRHVFVHMLDGEPHNSELHSVVGIKKIVVTATYACQFCQQEIEVNFDPKNIALLPESLGHETWFKAHENCNHDIRFFNYHKIQCKGC